MNLKRTFKIYHCFCSIFLALRGFAEAHIIPSFPQGSRLVTGDSASSGNVSEGLSSVKNKSDWKARTLMETRFLDNILKGNDKMAENHEIENLNFTRDSTTKYPKTFGGSQVSSSNVKRYTNPVRILILEPEDHGHFKDLGMTEKGVEFYSSEIVKSQRSSSRKHISLEQEQDDVVPNATVHSSNDSAKGKREGFYVKHYTNNRGEKIRRKRNLPQNDWCSILKKDKKHGTLDCRVWAHRKVCTLICHSGWQNARYTVFQCNRKQNKWQPEIQPCWHNIGKPVVSAPGDRLLKALNKAKETHWKNIDYIAIGEKQTMEKIAKGKKPRKEGMKHYEKSRKQHEKATKELEKDMNVQDDDGDHDDDDGGDDRMMKIKKHTSHIP